MGKEYINKLYGNSVRLRVCGLYVENDSLLMVKHKNIGTSDELWIPPGGGVEFGQSLEENLVREFKEETGLDVKVGAFKFVYEYQSHPLHAVEMFFIVHKISGDIIKGYDPEYSKQNQIIESVKMLAFREIDLMKEDKLHGIFSIIDNASDILNKEGLYKFKNIR